MSQEWFIDTDNDRIRINSAIAQAKAALERAQEGEPKKENIDKAVKEFTKAVVLWNEFYSASKKLKAGNDKLTAAVGEMRLAMEELRNEVHRLLSPPLTYATFLSANDDGTANIMVMGRKSKVNLHPGVKLDGLKPGQEVIVNDALAIIAPALYETQGEVVTVKDILDEDRLLVTLRHDEERVCLLADTLRGKKLRVGDHLMLDMRSGYLLEHLPKSEVEDLALEEVPDISYEDIGGLESQIEAIRDAVELPYLYPELFIEHKLTAPKGILLYGPPGCGKTMIAKAVANDLAKKISERRGETIKGFFLNIKGPELLNKYVGETERKIREVFLKAIEKASEDVPVFVFFDEMDALFRTRGSGISSDVETTIVPQLLAEIDGVEGMKNIIVIGASNRQDLIDPAVLRPGRLDVKIKIERPDAKASCRIIRKYSKPGVPLHSKFTPFPKRYETPNRLKTLIPDQWHELDAALAKIRESFGMHREDAGTREIRVAPELTGQAIQSIEAADLDAPDRARKIRDIEKKEWAFESWEFSGEEDAFNYLNYKTIEGMFITTPWQLVWVSSEGELVTVDTRFLEVTYANGDKEILYHRDFISGAMLESIVRRAKKRALKRFIETKTKGVMMIDYWQATREEFAENEDLPNTTNPDDWAKIQGKKGERVVAVRPISSQKLLPPPNGMHKMPRGTERVLTTGQYL